MWQLQIEIEYYSVKYFEHVTEFVALKVGFICVCKCMNIWCICEPSMSPALSANQVH